MDVSPADERPATWRYVVPVAPAGHEVTAARLLRAGALGIWEQSDRLVAWFADAHAEVPAGGTWQVEEDRDWQAEWKATIRPVIAGAVTIVPSWLADEDTAPDGGSGRSLRIVLDPGRAFGTGHHATTTLCLEALQTPDLMADLGGARVLDVGTGTGILAIAADLLGAAAVVGLDVDADAITVATDNARRNDVALDLRVGSTEVAGHVLHDVVVANLVTDVLVGLAGELTATVADGGWLVASGIRAGRQHEVVEALRAHATWAGTPVVGERDGWAVVSLRRVGAR